MIKILFVCHGNICRSPMAESVCVYELGKRGLKAVVSSAAAHSDELGNPPDRRTQGKLRREGVPLVDHRARLLAVRDGDEYDYILGMDDYNVRDIRRIVGNCRAKVCRLLDFSDHPRIVADPWYTGDFDAAYSNIVEGVNAFLDHLTENRLI